MEPGGTNLATALAAGGRIAFRCSGPVIIRITKLHSISSAVEIDGGGQVTLDGNNQTPFLASDADLSVRLVNLTIRRMGNANVATSGVVRAERVAVVNSRVLESQSPIRGNTEVTVEGSEFDSNRGIVIEAPNIGVARTRIRRSQGIPLLSQDGRVTITDSEFEGNGRSLFNGCSLTITRTTFANNNSSLSADVLRPGGALSTGCTTDIQSATFTGNTSTSDAGAIHISNTAPRVSISGSRFEGNSAIRDGGAIAMDPGGAPRRVLALRSTVFSRNRALVGAALSFGESPENETQLEVRGATFTGNVATDRGGAIAGTNVTVSIRRGVFLRNEAQSGAAIWLNMLAARESVIANSLFVLNKGPSGTFNGNTTRFINSTVVGSTGPGLVVFPGSTSPPQRAIRLANTIVENNSGGNCRSGTGSIVNEGSNLQFPGNTCGSGIPVAAALLDTFYAPILGGAARAQGDDKVCAAAPVDGHDLYGEKRPQADHCSIGAVEGDLQRIMRRHLASKKAQEKAEKMECPLDHCPYISSHFRETHIFQG